MPTKSHYNYKPLGKDNLQISIINKCLVVITLLSCRPIKARYCIKSGL